MCLNCTNTTTIRSNKDLHGLYLSQFLVKYLNRIIRERRRDLYVYTLEIVCLLGYQRPKPDQVQ